MSAISGPARRLRTGVEAGHPSQVKKAGRPGRGADELDLPFAPQTPSAPSSPAAGFAKGLCDRPVADDLISYGLVEGSHPGTVNRSVDRCP